MYSKCPVNNDIRGTQAISLKLVWHVRGSVNIVRELTAFKQAHAFCLRGKRSRREFQGDCYDVRHVEIIGPLHLEEKHVATRRA